MISSAEELEILRATSPAMHHRIDPFFWLRGCHPKDVVNIPWAHARLTPDEYYRFVKSYEETEAVQVRLNSLNTLNNFTLKRWRLQA